MKKRIFALGFIVGAVIVTIIANSWASHAYRAQWIVVTVPQAVTNMYVRGNGPMGFSWICTNGFDIGDPDRTAYACLYLTPPWRGFGRDTRALPFQLSFTGSAPGCSPEDNTVRILASSSSQPPPANGSVTKIDARTFEIRVTR